MSVPLRYFGSRVCVLHALVIGDDIIIYCNNTISPYPIETSYFVCGVNMPVMSLRVGGTYTTKWHPTGFELRRIVVWVGMCFFLLRWAQRGLNCLNSCFSFCSGPKSTLYIIYIHMFICVCSATNIFPFEYFEYSITRV